MPDAIVRLAVMGVTGSGKSNFIRTASGQKNVVVGDSLESCTMMVESVPFAYQGRRIELIDTPGFDDSFRSESEVLAEIATWLATAYKNSRKNCLNGIIYLQSIRDTRMPGSSLRNLKVFRELCGAEPLKNIVLATTWWDDAKKNGWVKRALSNEAQLKDNGMFWAPLISRGSRVMRFENTHESALNIVQSMINQAPVVLQIQSEMIDQDKKLLETSAATEVHAEIARLEQQYRKDLANAKSELQQAFEQKDQEMAELMRQQKEQSEMQLERLQQDMAVLRYDRRADSRRYENQLTAERSRHRRLEEQIKSIVERDQLKNFDETVQKLEVNSTQISPPEAQLLFQEQLHQQKKKPFSDRTTVKLLIELAPFGLDLVLSLLGAPNLNTFFNNGGGGS